MFWKQPNSSSQNIRVQQFQPQRTQHDQEEIFRQADKNSQQLPPSAGYSWEKPASQNMTQQKYIKNINISPQKGVLNNSALANSYESDESMDSRILPPNFETNIRQLELAIEANPDIELDKIKELIMLYTLAVEYYDSNNDDKFIYYKNKIVYLHQQDNVIKAMNKHISPTFQSSSHFESESQKKLEEQQQFSARQAEGRDKIKGFEEKAAEGVTDEDVNQIMDTQDSNVLEQEMIIEKDLKKQTNLILKRLNQRMKSKTKCSTPPFNSFRKLEDDETHNVFCRTESDGVEEAITNGKKIEKPLMSNPIQQQQVKKKNILNTREKRQKFSISVIDTIVSNFIADKKQSLSEEKKLKIDLIEFEYEKLLFQIEKNLTLLTEEERNKIERDKDHKIFLVEEEFNAKEQQEINIIQEKYAKNTFPKKVDQNEEKQD